MIIETAEFVALSDVMSAKKMKEMADEISRLESEVDMWKESAQSCEVQVSMLRKEPIQQCYDGCLVLSYDKLRDTLYNIADFNLSCSFSTILHQCLPSWASDDDTNKVAALFPLLSQPKKEVHSVQVKVPEELMTEDAIALKEKLMDGGMINESWQPVNLTNTESSMMAKVICEMLSITSPWKLFGSLWNRNPDALRSSFNKALEQRKTLVFQDKLKRTLS